VPLNVFQSSTCLAKYNRTQLPHFFRLYSSRMESSYATRWNGHQSYHCRFLLWVGNGSGRAMAQTVSHQHLTAKARVRTRVSQYGICGEQSGTGTHFSLKFFGFPLSLSFHHGFLCSYITWGMNNRLVGGRSSET
jgi:hypothetical protein